MTRGGEVGAFGAFHVKSSRDVQCTPYVKFKSAVTVQLTDPNPILTLTPSSPPYPPNCIGYTLTLK